MHVDCAANGDTRIIGEFVWFTLRDARAKLMITEETPEASSTRSESIGVGWKLCSSPAAADAGIED
jgi:hypothetical protein